MRLTANNIKFVRELSKDGITYQWFVSMRSGNVSDSRCYVNYDESGKTVAELYPFDNLPKAVQKYIYDVGAGCVEWCMTEDGCEIMSRIYEKEN